MLTWARVAAVLRGGNIPASNSARPIIIMKTSTVAVVIHDVSAGLTHPSIFQEFSSVPKLVSGVLIGISRFKKKL